MPNPHQILHKCKFSLLTTPLFGARRASSDCPSNTPPHSFFFQLQHANFLVAACMWDLVPRPGIEPGPPCIGSVESYPLDHQGSPCPGNTS